MGWMVGLDLAGMGWDEMDWHGTGDGMGRRVGLDLVGMRRTVRLNVAEERWHEMGWHSDGMMWDEMEWDGTEGCLAASFILHKKCHPGATASIPAKAQPGRVATASREEAKKSPEVTAVIGAIRLSGANCIDRNKETLKTGFQVALLAFCSEIALY